MTVVKKVPPDGGYAWIIMCAFALNNFVTIPIMQGFGLIYKETFEELNFTATEISMILNTCGAFSMLIGIVNGPLLKQFGFRKISLVGAALITCGVTLTSFATKFKHFMISHGFITSFGMGIGMASYSLAVNSYFTTKRGKAIGMGMTIAGLGPILMPQLMSFLLYAYGVQGATMILAAIAAHGFPSALLLQPLKWHMKDEIVEEENEKLEGKSENGNVNRKDSSEDIEGEAMVVLDSTLSGSMWSLNEERRRKASVSSRKGTKNKSKESLNEENGKSAIDKEESQPLQPINGNDKDHKEKEETKEKKSLLKRIGHSIVDMFDLKLLKDPIYLNIMFGMSLAIFAELNFSVLTPFILGDYDLTVPQIATFMSVVSILDIIFRFCAPFVGDFLKQPHRVMYLISMLLLIITRFMLLLTGDYQMLLAVAAALGIAKGFRTVYYSLVIPSYVPIEMLASASGIQMTVNGIFIFIGGPAIGFIRDISSNYRNCIYVINGVTFMTFLMWSIEMLYVKYRKKNETNDDIENNMT